MKLRFQKVQWFGLTALFLLSYNPSISSATVEKNFYTVQKNVGGYYEMLIDAFDPLTVKAVTLTLKISGSTADQKFGEYLMAAMTQAYHATLHFGIDTYDHNHLFCTFPGYMATGIRFSQMSGSDFDLFLYKDGNDDIVLKLFDGSKYQMIKLRSNATAEEIAFFDYAVNTIIISKYIFRFGTPTITPAPDEYKFNIKLIGDRSSDAP
jgi:hypothetical protein